jgi:hypothetical protein
MRANRRFLGNSASVTPDPCALMSTTEERNSAGGQAAAVVDEDQTSWSSVGAYTSLIRSRRRDRLANRRQNLVIVCPNTGRPVASGVDPADPKLGKIELVGHASMLTTGQCVHGDGKDEKQSRPVSASVHIERADDGKPAGRYRDSATTAPARPARRLTSIGRTIALPGRDATIVDNRSKLRTIQG